MKLYPCHAGQPDPINGRSCPATPGHARPGALKRAAYPARFALGVLLALAGALGVTAPARADTLVSNLGQADRSNGLSFFFAVSQEFVTGDNPGGYTLTSVETKLYGLDAAELAKLTVSLHAAHSSAADSTGAPAASLGTLTHPASVPADNIFEFTTSGIALAAGTRYAVVLQPAADLLRLSTGAEGVVLTVSRNEDTSSKIGWSIVDELWTKAIRGGVGWLRNKDEEVNLKMRINGTVAGVTAPTASDSSVTATEDIDYPFTAADFSFSGVNPADTLDSVTIRSLPAPGTGVLQLNGEDLSAFDTITSTELAIGRLTYTSPADANGMDHASFDFLVSNGTARSNTYTMTIHVTAASDRPTARDSAVITNANVDYTFSVADFNFLDSDDGDTLTDVTVVTPPGAGEGALRFRARKVSAGATITSANLTTNNLTYRPPSNVSGPGYASFTFKVSDGAADSVSTYTMTIHVAPTASDSAVTATEDTDYRFSAADFNISGADTLTTVKLVTLPDADKGVLKLLNAPASIGANLSNADFTAGRLIYTPPANANGRGYASFDFLVSDDRDDSDSYTMTIHVTAVNDLPTASDNNTVTTNEDTDYPFTVADFNFLDSDDGDTLASVKIVTLPGADQGALKLDGTPVSVNNIVTRAKLEANSFTYAPPVNANGMDYASFTFQVSDGAADSASPNTMTISVTAVNDPPTASDHTVTANANMDYTFTVDDFNFVDVDGDTLSSISIVASLAPDTGALQFNGMDRASQSVFGAQQIAEGRFTYRPPALASGMNYASFTFLVYDGQSFNASSNTMTINVTDNLAPTASDNTVTHPVNTDYTFSATDFNFSDQNAGDALKSLSLVTLPGTGKGVLKLDNVTINATNTTVTLAQLEANDLIYSPPTNANGANYASFTFQVSDGHLSSASSNTMTINIEPRFVPTASDNTVTTTEDIDYRFTVDDFRFADQNLGETLTSVSLVTLPDVGKGVLKLDGTAVSVTNTIVTSARINDGHLIYTPPDNANGTDYTSFTFQVSDGRDDSVSPNTMTITVTAVNDPPTGAPGFNSLEPMVGHLLSSLPATIADVDGLNSPNYRYQWVRVDGSAQTDISRATSISYRPSADDVGEKLRVKYTFTDDDGTTGTLTSATTLAVLAGANTVPTTSDNTVTTNEDTDYRFTVTDFNFLDGDSVDALTSVKLVTLPGAGEGVLKLDGETVSVTNTIVTRARIDDGHLNYIPPANASGSDYASFTFQVSDGRDGGDSVSSNTMTITVTAANDPPTARDRTVTTAEDTNYTFTAADFNFADVDSGSALTRVKLVTLPDAGKGLLQLDGDPVSVNAIVTLVQLDASDLTYAPPANANGTGYASFTFQVSDGAADSASPNTMTINVTAVNDPPTARDSEFTADENTEYTFKAADFNFADAEGDMLTFISIGTPPGAGKGTLQYGINIVGANQSIIRSLLDNGEYTYSPPANVSGANYASFTFRVGTLDVYSKPVLSVATYTMTINIQASVAPTAANSEVTIRANTDYTFSAADFNFDDLNVGDTLKAVTIVTLPSAGRGVLDNFTDDIVGDTEFPLANINVGQIGYIPPAGASGANYASFTFKVRDDTTYSAVYTMTINILANSAPTAANSEVTTKVGVDYTFSVADFHFADQDVGDTLTSVRLVTVPGAGKGALQFDGRPVGGSGDISQANLDNGRFTYRPPANAIGSGYTSFTFQVGDDQPPSATYSAVYTMTINIEASFAPTASDNTVTTDENTDYTFKAADFKFADRNVGDTLKHITIQTLPRTDRGSLLYDSGLVSAQNFFTKAGLDAGLLIYRPTPNTSGADHASFTFKVIDGTADSVSPNTMTIDVTAEPNVAPTASDSTVTATEDTDYPFTVIDFDFADVNSRDALESITLVTLPGAGKGVLELEGEAVRARDRVTRAQINANSLIYVPPVNANGADYARFTFQVSDGAADSASPNTMSITVTAVNDPPTSSNREVSAYRDGDYTFSAADFPFADVDGEPLVGLKLRTLPDSGTGTLKLQNGTISAITGSGYFFFRRDEIDNGDFSYSPPADTRSADFASFTFQVVDDGPLDSLLTYTMTINFQARVAPTAANGAVSANKNTDYTFKAADFRFADVNVGDTLQRVRLVTLPALGKGALRFDGKLFRARYITRAQLDDGRLTYYSPTNASGPGYASFTFQVRDDTMYSATYTMTINLPVNVPPTAGASEVTTRQDTNYPFTAADFIFDDADSADTLARVKLVTLPGAGKGLLKLGGVDVSAGDTVTLAQLDARNLTYVPPTNASGMGYARFTFQVSDGTADSVSPNTMTINVTAVPNVAPTARDNVVTADENGNYPFTAADFKFADVNSRDTLAGVKIVTLPSGEGTLELDGVAVSANALVTSARLGANSLIYTPEANTLGAGYASFAFQVYDGQLFSASRYIMTINVAAPNSPPTARDGAVTATEDTDYTFTAANFKFIDRVNPDDTLASVSLATLPRPGTGVLKLDGAPARVSAIVTKAQLDANSLTYTPPTNASGAGYTAFHFRVNDGRDDSQTAGRMTINVTAVNDAPTTANSAVTIYGNTDYPFKAADFSFFDVDSGDTLGGVRILTLPTTGRGTLELNGNPVSARSIVTRAHLDNSRFIYLPPSNASGTDYAGFTFRVFDDQVAEDRLYSSTYPMTINVTTVNNPPTASASAVTAIEDTDYTFTVADFSFSDNNSPDALARVKLVTLPGPGTGLLKLDGMPVSARAIVTRAQLDGNGLTYVPPANANGMGYANFTFQVNDGTADSASSYTMTIHVTAVNDIPTARNSEVTTLVNTDYTFKAADFNFVDVDGHTLFAVLTQSLPALGRGNLRSGNFDFHRLSQENTIGRVSLDNGQISYRPPMNASGVGYASFTFQVYDGHPTGVFGFDLPTYTMTINVLPVAPTASDSEVTTLVNTDHTFTADDFNFVDRNVGDTLASVSLVTLPGPNKGALQLDGSDLTAVVDITRTQLDDGRFTYSPPVNTTGVGYARFTFKVHDGGVSSASTYTMTINVQANHAPTASDSAVTATEDTAYSFTAVDFSFVDRNAGDTLASVKLVTLPRAGTGVLQLDGLPVSASDTVTGAQLAASDLTYTPPMNANGTDHASFTFKVSDGFVDSALSYTMAISVTAVSDPPTASNNEVSATVNTDYTFSATDFSFFDGDSGDTLASVRIVTLPAVGQGLLKLDSSDLTGAADITQANLDNGDFTYTPPMNASGVGYASFTFTVKDGSSTSSALTYTMTITVMAAPVPAVSIVASGAAVTEGTAATFTLTADPAPTSDISVTVTVTDSGAFAEDGQTGTKMVTIGTSGTATLTVTTVEDTIDEPNGAITAAVTDNTGYSADNTAHTASVTVNDDDAALVNTPVVSVSGGMPVTEGTAATFTLTAVPAPTSGIITVTVTVTDSGAFASRGQTGTKMVTIDAGGTATLSVATVEDTIDEPNGAITVAVTGGGTGYSVHNMAHTAPVTVNDDDATALTLTGPKGDITEGGAKAFTVSLSRALVDGESLVAPLTLTGSATQGTDYTLACASATGVVCASLDSGDATVTFTGSSSAATATSITLTALADSAAEPVETVIIGLGSTTPTGLGGGAMPTDNLADFSIVDPTPVAAFALALHSAPENAGTRNVTVSLSPAQHSETTLTYSVGGTATAGSDNDFTIANSGSVTLSSGATSVDIPVLIVDDSMDESAETVLLTLTAGSGYTVGTTSVHTLTINDNDAPATNNTPVVSVSGEMPVTEGTDVTFTLTADPAPTSDLSVAVMVTDSGAFAEGGQTGTKTVTIPSGDTSAMLTVTTAVDTTDEPNGAITAAVTGGTGYSAHDTAHTAAVTVNDDDATAVTLTGLADNITEGDTKAFTVNLSRVLVDGESLVAPLTLAGTATRGTDYTLACASATGVACASLDSGTATVTFTGSSSATIATSMTITLTALADNAAEPAETVVIGLDRPTPTGLGGGATTTDTLADFNIVAQTPVAAFDLALQSASEGAGTHNVTVNLSPAQHSETTLTYSVGGTATAGSGNDFTIADSGSVTLSAGATSVDIPVLIADDNADENAETVLLTLTPASGYTVGAKSVHTLTINDNDGSLITTPVVSLSGEMPVTEGTAATFTLTADPVPDSDIGVTVMVTDSGAFAEGGQTGTKTVTIPAGNATATLTVTTVGDTTDESNGAITAAVTRGTGYLVHGSSNSASVTVNDDDATAVTLTGLADAITEGGTKAFTVNLSRALVDGERLVAPLTLAGTATRGTDYTLACASATGVACASLDSGSATVTFTGSSSTTIATSMTITLMALADNAAETAETVVIGLGTPMATGLDGVATTTDTLADFNIVDPTPVADFDLDVHSASEDAGTRNVTVNLSPAVPHAGITLTYSVGGTATVGSGNDFTIADSGSVTLTVGATSVNIPVLIVDDSMGENAETVLLTLTAGSGYTVGAKSVHTLTINDNDDPPKTIPVVSVSGGVDVTEGTAATFTLTADPAPDSDISVTVMVTDSGAFAGGGQTGTKTVTIPADTTSAMLTVTTAVDTTDEPNGAITAAVTGGTGYSAHDTAHTASVTVNDDDATAVTLTGLADNITEGDTKAFTVNLNRGLVDGERLVAPLTLNGTATRGTDYTLACASATGVACAGLDSGDATVTFTGSSSATTATLMTITLMALADNAAEPEETVVIGLGTLRITGLDGAAHTDNLSDFRIVDPTPVAAFELALRSASEDAGTHNVTVNLSPAQHSETTLNYSVGGTATAGSGNDFTIANSGSVTVSAGATSVNIPVLIVDDNADEGAETVILTLTAVTGYTVGATSVHTLTINDDDGSLMTTPVVSVSGGMAVTEGTDVTFTLTADPAPDSDLLVAVMVTDSGAFAGGGQTGTKTVTIRAGTTSAMLTVTTAVDTIDEPNGAITAAVTGGTGYSAHDTAHTASVTVNDDDATAVTLTGLADNITEGGTKAFTVNLNRGLVDGESLAAPLTLAGTATRGTDYTLACASATGVACAGLDSGDATVTFTGSSSATTATLMTITLMALADNAAEPEETVVIGLGTLRITGLDGAAHTDNLSDFRIVDPTPVAAFELALRSASEDAGTHNVTVNLSPAQHSETTLNYSVGGTATAGSGNDFTIANSGSVTVSAGATSVNIPVLIVDDNADEGAETVILTLTAVTGYTVGATSVHTLTINDDDGSLMTTPVVSVSGGMAVTEGTDVTFTLTADPAPDSDLLVAVMVTDSGAFAGGGQTGTKTVTIRAGTTSAMLTVTTAVDTIDEPNGAITAAVTGGTGYSAHDTAHTASVTVNDDDATAVTLTGLADNITEGGTKAFTVNLNRGLVDGESLAAPLTLAGTATRGTDYTLACASATGVACAGLDSGDATVTFTGSSSATIATSMTITLMALADNAAEPEETVVIGLGTPMVTGLDGGAKPIDTLADFNIVDPTPVADFDVDVHSASENAGTHNVTVNLSPAQHSETTLTYSVGGTATAGSGNDFTIANSGSVTLSAGATSVDIPVLIVDDNADENAETVLLTLIPASGYTVGSTNVHTLTINDNDATVVTLTGLADNITEGDTKAFTVNLSRALVDGEKLVAPLTLNGTATRGTDYTLACASATGVACASLDSGSATVTFTGSSSATTATLMTITLMALADNAAEPTAETVVIGLGTPTATGLDGVATTTDNLADFGIVDPTPVAAFDVDVQSVSEGAGTHNVTVNLSPAVPHAGITLTYSVGGTATVGSGNDFTIADSGSVTLSSGATSVNIPVLIVDDSMDENAETVILTLTPASGYTVGATSVHTLTINDNDAPAMGTPVVSVSGGMAVTEGTAATFTLTADPAPDSNISVTVTVTDSGAFAGVGQTGTKTVTINTSGTATLTVTTVNDTIDESNGAITAAVTHGTGYSVHNTTYIASVTVNDNDAAAGLPPTNTPPAFGSASSARVAENQSAVLTVTAVEAQAQDGAVRYSLSGGEDQARFLIDRETGALTFAGLPDYENPDDSAGNNEYIVTVRATSGAGLRERSAEQTITVTVTGVDEVVLKPRDAVTESGVYQLGRSTITATITATATASAEVSVTLPDALVDVNGEVIRRLSIEIVDAPSTTPLPNRNQFKFDKEKLVDINVWPAPKGGVELCLPVSAALRAAADADGQPLAALHFTSGRWLALAGADKGEQVCVSGVSRFSPFMAGFRTVASASMERALSTWLARFGRTVTDQVLEAVTDRLAAPRSPGMKVSLAGRALPIRGQDSTVREDRPHGNAAGSLRASLAERGALDALSNWISHTGAVGDDLPHGAPGAGSRALQSWSPTGRDLTFGTSFSLTGEPRADGSLLSVWGRGAMTNFAGRDGGLALDGEAQTLLVGAERSWRGWTTGGVLGRSRAEGGYRSAAEAGEIEATLTGVYPWAGRAVNDHVSAWAALGYGAGDLTFQPEDGAPVRADLILALGAAGLRGEVLRPLQAGGLSLAVKGDVRVTRTSSKAAGDTMVGRLMAAEADVWRVRAGVEGARSFMANGDPLATVTPSFEVGVRLDGGDAETGFGADVGGGVALVDPGRGVTLEMKARGLVSHEDKDFREWGASAALAWEPRPQSGRGLSLSLTQSWGVSSSGGMDALLSRDTLVGLAASDTAPAGRRLEAELGYAMTVFGGDFTATPNAGLTLTEDGRDWRLGWRLTPAWPDGSGFDVDLDATRSETGDGTPAHAVTLRGALRF